MVSTQAWQWLLGAEPDTTAPGEQLVAAVSLVAELVPCAGASSITERDGVSYFTSAASSPLALQLDLAQYDGGDGPCMAATRDRQVHLVHDTVTAHRFAAYAETASRMGVRSSMSVPINAGARPAALNIYAHPAEAFGDRDRAVARFMGRALSRRLAGSAADRVLSDVESDLVAQRRALIRAAQERLELAAGRELGRIEVFDELTRRSRNGPSSIFDVARELVTTDGAL